jgi:transposase-like protein
MPRRRTFSNRQKLAIIDDVTPRLAEGCTLTSVAEMHAVVPKQLRTWLQNEELLREANPSANSLNKGNSPPMSRLDN